MKILRIAVLIIVGVLFVAGQLRAVQTDARIEKSAEANCEVVAVLLSNRADRDKTIKLFEPIRRENPVQFDKLVKKAEQGDKRLERVQGDLSCDIN